MFVTTINRTTRSYLGAILAAEYALRLLPVGTHDWNKFVTPDEVQRWMKEAGCTKVRLVHGMFYLPFVNKWKWIPDTSVNYAVYQSDFGATRLLHPPLDFVGSDEFVPVVCADGQKSEGVFCCKNRSKV